MESKMSEKVLNDVRGFRESLGETQTEFWLRFGLTQPCGSRYENGQPIPAPTALLICLLATEKISKKEIELLLSEIKENKNVSIA